MIFDILESKMQSRLGLIPGETLFRSYTPPEVSVAVMTRVPLEGIKIDPFIRNWYRGRLQIVLRHTDPVQGEILMNRVANALRVDGPEEHPASLERGRATISLFIPEALPVRFPRLDGNGIEWSQHFLAAFTFEPTG